MINTRINTRLTESDTTESVKTTQYKLCVTIVSFLKTALALPLLKKRVFHASDRFLFLVGRVLRCCWPSLQPGTFRDGFLLLPLRIFGGQGLEFRQAFPARSRRASAARPGGVACRAARLSNTCTLVSFLRLEENQSTTLRRLSPLFIGLSGRNCSSVQRCTLVSLFLSDFIYELGSSVQVCILVPFLRQVPHG